MRLYVVELIENLELRSGLHLLEVQAPQLAEAVKPGQFCMVRCVSPNANDPFLRRPYFVHGVDRARGRCTLLVQQVGRGSLWLQRLPRGSQLDLLGPLGKGWTLYATTRNALLICEARYLSSMTLLAQFAINQDIAVTLLIVGSVVEESYPPMLLNPEVEYQIIGREDQHDHLGVAIDEYLRWADAAFICVEQESARHLYLEHERLRKRQFAQGLLWQALPCASGVCLACNLETPSGSKLICRDGPVFDLRAIAR